MAVTHFRSHSASGVRLSLQTIFSHNPLQRSSKQRKLMATTPSSFNSSPASSFSSFTGKSREADGASQSTYTSTYTKPRNLVRRQPSAIDLALEEEQSADHVELIGLGLLEPRPRANTGSSTSSQCSMMEFIAESMQSPTVLDGIFEVMERA
ncbi:hypothetical protein PV10_00854 [Exophiala mesophila]|uniref:Uncharacterized protein n=1 Tax=Exophiala mesophila TaxID=212818 RepID=A0A0D2ADV9_EXOME|nr:uncharacterized protein PV10_00854 [Exophiala mesophila]KIV97053.1 hypothetical protein PV10_00854 [Exophiala mesophila]